MVTLTVGLSNMVNRFHATFRTDLDDTTIDAMETDDATHGVCVIPRPNPPG